MSTVSKEFDSYKIWYYTNFSPVAMVYCYQGSNYVGRIRFFEDDSPMPENVNYTSGPSLVYPLSQFNDLISILRYEKPLYLFMNLNNLIGMVGTTDREPVGEEES